MKMMPFGFNKKEEEEEKYDPVIQHVAELALIMLQDMHEEKNKDIPKNGVTVIFFLTKNFEKELSTERLTKASKIKNLLFKEYPTEMKEMGITENVETKTR